MASKIQGNAFNVIMPAGNATGVAAQHELRLHLKYLERTAKETGNIFKASTELVQNAATGANQYVTRVFTDMGTMAAEGMRQRVHEVLHGRPGAPGIGNISALGSTELTKRNISLTDKRGVAGVRVLDPHGKASVSYDKHTGTLTTVSEKADQSTTNYINATVREGRKREKAGAAMLAALEASKRPGTAEFDEAVGERLGNRAAERKAMVAWAKKHKGDPLANQILRRDQNERTRGRRALQARVKRGLSSAAHWAQRKLHSLIQTAVNFLAASFTLAGRTLSAVLSVGETVRQRNLNDLKLNLAPETNRAWVKFAKNNGFDEDALVQALGGLFGSFGTISNFAKSYNSWVMALGPDLVETMSMFSGKGDKNTLPMLNSLMGVLLEHAQKGFVDLTKQDVTDEGQALKEIIQQLSPLNRGMSSLLSAFLEQWHKYQKGNPGAGIAQYIKHLEGLTSRTGFEAFLHSGVFDLSEGGGDDADRVVFDEASMTALDNLRGAISTFKLLGEDALNRIAINTMNIVNWVRSIVTDFLRPFFPAFAAREDERAAIVNAQSREVINSRIDTDRQGAEVALEQIIPKEKVQSVIEAIRIFSETNNIKPLIDAGLTETEIAGVLNPKTLGFVHLYLKDLEQLAKLDELAKKGDKQAYLVDNATSLEQNKDAVMNMLLRIDAARQSWREQDPNYYGQVDIFFKEDEARKRQQKEFKAGLVVKPPNQWQKDWADTDPTVDGSNYRRMLMWRESIKKGPISPLNTLRSVLDFAESSYKSREEGNGAFTFPNPDNMNEFTTLWDEEFKNLMLAAKVVYAKTDDMSGDEVKEFYNTLAKFHNKIMKQAPDKAEELAQTILDPLLFKMNTGASAEYAEKVAGAKRRIDVSDKLPSWIAYPVADLYNNDTARSQMERADRAYRYHTLADALPGYNSEDMLPLDAQVSLIDLSQRIQAQFGRTVYDMLGGAGDNQTLQFVGDASKSGDLVVIFRAPGQPDREERISDVLRLGQKVNMTLDTGPGYQNWLDAFSK